MPSAKSLKRALGSSKKSSSSSSKRKKTSDGYTRTGGYYGRFGDGDEAEMKFFDTDLAFNIDSTMEIPASGGQLCLVPQGDTESTRQGMKMCIKSLRMTAVITHTPTPSTSAGIAATSTFLVLDTQCNGAAATPAEVFAFVTAGRVLPLIQNSKRFKILKQWNHAFNTGGGAATQYASTTKWIKYYRRLDIPIMYNGATGAITEIRSNNLFLMAVANSTSDDEVNVSGKIRLRYSDKNR